MRNVKTDNQPILVVGLCGSLRQGSTTHAALTIALAGAKEAGAEVELLDLSKYQLIFHGSVVDESEYPSDVFKLKEKVKRAHGILLGTPEYHGSFSGVLKNALDLMWFEEFEKQGCRVNRCFRWQDGRGKCLVYVENRRCDITGIGHSKRCFNCTGI